MASTTKRGVRRKSPHLGDRGGKPLSLREQANWLEPIGFRCVVRKGCLTCTGIVQPTEISRRYAVEIQLRAGDRPRIRIQSPALDTRSDGKSIPHTYGPDSPCVYYPKTQARDWTPSMAIAKSVVPWLGLWLIHYEGWLATGYWEGGGIEH